MLRRLVALVALGTVLAPLLALLGQVAVALPAVGEEGAVLALPTGRRLTLLARGGSLAVAVALAGMALGALAGTALWRLPARARRLVRVGVWVAAFVPSYVHSLAWTAAAGEVQRLLSGLGLPRVPLRGWGMAWWVQLMALAPLAVGLALAGLESLDREAIDAARPLRSDAAVLARVALPMAAPLVAAGGALLFVLALTDYAVPSLFQVGVYAMEILTEFSANHDPVRASLVSMPLLALAAVAVGGALRLLPRVPQRPQAPGDVWVVAPRWPRWLRALQGAALAILAAQIVVPLATLAPLAAAEPDLAGALYAARREIARSLAVA
ncbi:MAG: iron ABC transporter permease, partial [Chloroflexi bacterium]|nr:iron ABC transporter permease [Chloroflexota bacterium]